MNNVLDARFFHCITPKWSQKLNWTYPINHQLWTSALLWLLAYQSIILSCPPVQSLVSYGPAAIELTRNVSCNGRTRTNSNCKYCTNKYCIACHLFYIVCSRMVRHHVHHQFGKTFDRQLKVGPYKVSISLASCLLLVLYFGEILFQFRVTYSGIFALGILYATYRLDLLSNFFSYKF